MIKNYFKIALRNLFKRKALTLINLLGLATGMAVCLLIVLFLKGELSYDQHHQKADNIYRVVLDRKYPGRSSAYSIIPQSIGPAMQAEFPEVLECTRIFNFGGGGNGNFFMRVGEKIFEESTVLAADSNFFRVFTGNFLAGDKNTALHAPNSVVLNEATAIKMYGSAQGALGKQFETDGDQNQNNTYTITGVCTNWPETSHFTFNILLSVTGFPFIREPNYVNFSAHTYLLLATGSNTKALQAKFPGIVDKYVSGEIQRLFGQSFKDFQTAGNGYDYSLQALKDIHLTSNREAELSANGNKTSVYIFSVIAVFILFLACINFINLSTARSVERAKEVGIRKTFGSGKETLVMQFLVESVLVALIALLVAFALMFLLLPLFNQLSGRHLSMSYFFNPATLISVFIFAIIVGVVAGIYPAFVISSFNPIVVLKGRFKSTKYGLGLRNGLVVFQFAISVILIIASIVVSQQMKYMLGGKLGFNKDYILTIQRADLLENQTQAFKTELAKIPGVEMVGGTSAMPGTQNFFGVTFQQPNATESLTGRGIITDENFAASIDLQLKEGRFFSKEFGTDSLALVLNEKAVEEFGLKNPIGARLVSPDGFFNAPDGSSYTYHVVGVVKDFHFQSLHQKVAPLIFINSAKFNEGAANVLAVRINAQNVEATMKNVATQWKAFVKSRPFNYTFLNQTLATQYEAEQRSQRIFSIFSWLAIFIASIGLLGLVAYTTQQRTREISIRKVLGASSFSIVNMLSKDFLKLVAIASLIGFPVAWWALHKWLQDFAYRINMPWWVFIIAGITTLVIAMATISTQAIRAANANPVKSLRSE